MNTTPISDPPSHDLWRRALTEPSLRDLPFKVETNAYGQLIMSPHKPRHSLQQSRISILLREIAPGAGLPPGEAVTEFAVETAGGIKVPDVVWISEQRLAELPEDAEASPVIPELVIEVLSKGNTRAEIEEKRRLYFETGAEEVWTCSPEGRLTFYTPAGEVPTSRMFPSFPARLS